MKKNETDATPFPSLDAEKIKEVASSVADEAAKFIKKHPLECVGGALLVGVVVGVLINRKLSQD